MKRSDFGRQLTAAISSPLAQRVAISVFLAIIFIEVVILVPSYLKKETDLFAEVADLVGQTVRMEFFADETYSRAQAGKNASELLRTRHLLGVAVIEDGTPIAFAGDTEGSGFVGGADPDGYLGIIPYRRLSNERVEILLEKQHFEIAFDIVAVTDVSHVPGGLADYVLRISGLVILISAFVTLVTMIVLWQMLLKRTLALSDRMQEAGGYFTEEIKLPASETDRNDEIGALWRSFGGMLKTIRDSVRATEDLARFPAENPNPIIRCSPDGAIAYANEAAKNIRGFFDDEAHTKASADVRRRVDRSFKGDRETEFEIAFDRHYYACTAVPVVSRNYVNIYARDVTALKRAEEELQKRSADLLMSNTALKETMAGLEAEIASRTRDLVEANEQLQKQMHAVARTEARFRAFAASAADWYWEMDHNLRFSYFSENFESVTGVPPAQLLGKTREETGIPGVDPALWEKQLDDLANHRPFRNFIHPRFKPDGSTVYLSINGVPTFDEDGTFYGYRGTGSDVTVLHEASEELRRAKELAERAAKARSDFLATMSHEIRTPMNGIIGMSELLRETKLADDQLIFADTILSSAKGLLLILNDILDLAKFESGGFDLEHVSFTLAELVEGVTEPLSLQAVQRGNNLAVVLDPGLPWSVAGDPYRLRQVLLNLAGNAVKFTENGDITIEIVEQYRGADDVTVLFDVRDTGIGISVEDQDRLFKDFSQVDQSVTRKYGGTGLGLSISKRLVELMGGSIGVSSELGEGSSFRFALTFPIVQTDAPESDTAFLEGVRAAVVDDNTTNLRVMAGYLSGFDVAYELSDDPKRALKSIRAASKDGQPFDVVFLDYSMPDIDGGALAEELTEAFPGAERPKLILLSSLAVITEDGAAKAGLFDAKIMKPVTRKSLLAGLRAALGQDTTPVEEPAVAKITAENAPRLLLAEDNPINARIALSMLQSLGCEVDVAADGEEAVEAVAFVPYDLILMDIHMPRMGGIEAATAIKGAGGMNAQTPILAVTADVMLNISEGGLAGLFVGVLTKPYTAEAMRAALARSMPAVISEPHVNEASAEGQAGAASIIDRAIVQDLIAQLGNEETHSILEGVESDLDHFEADLIGYKDSDTATKASAAHVRAGTCASTGLAALTGVLRGIEHAARAGDAEGWDKQLNSLPEVVEATKAELGRLMEELI